MRVLLSPRANASAGAAHPIHQRSQTIMRTLIQGGWVVGYGANGHELYQDGSVVFEDDRIVHAGPRFDGPVDRRIDAVGKLVSPGFVNCHLHAATNASQAVFLDGLKADYFGSNFIGYATAAAHPFRRPGTKQSWPERMGFGRHSAQAPPRSSMSAPCPVERKRSRAWPAISGCARTSGLRFARRATRSTAAGSRGTGTRSKAWPASSARSPT